jgi:hypothetical protein
MINFKMLKVKNKYRKDRVESVIKVNQAAFLFVSIDLG